MSKIFRILQTKEQRTPPNGYFRPCVRLECGEYAQIAEDVNSLKVAQSLCAVYSYGRPTRIFSASSSSEKKSKA